MNATTIHSSEIVGQLVLIEADPIRQRVKHAIAGFLAGYCGTTLCGFYRYCSQERLIERDPSAHVRRPKQNYEPSTLDPDRNELGAFLVQAGLCGGRDHALACLLALNGLRISEALGA